MSELPRQADVERHAPGITAGEVGFIDDIARASGIDLVPLLDAAGLPRDLFVPKRAETAIPMPTYFRLLSALSDQAGDEAVTASERSLQPGTARLVLAGITSDMSLYQAMSHIANAYDVVHAGHYNHVTHHGSYILYEIDDRGFPFTISGQNNTRHVFMESVMVYLHSILAEISSAPLEACIKAVDTRRDRETDVGGAFLKVWPAPVRYRAKTYGLHYDASVQQIPVRPLKETAFAHSAVYEVVADRVSTTHAFKFASLEERVCVALRQGARDQSEVAQKLEMSVATLRRQLVSSGLSYRVLKNQIQIEQAQHLLKSGVSVGDVADRLGFSDARSFSRAFKSQTGQTPASYRSSHLE